MSIRPNLRMSTRAIGLLATERMSLQDSADSRGGAAVWVDRGGMVVALDVERHDVSVAHVHHPRVVSRAEDDPLPRGGEELQEASGRFVAAVLGPLGVDYRPLGLVGLPARATSSQSLSLGRVRPSPSCSAFKPAAFLCPSPGATTGAASRRGRPSGLRSASAALSGWGIRPTTFPSLLLRLPRCCGGSPSGCSRLSTCPRRRNT